MAQVYNNQVHEPSKKETIFRDDALTIRGDLVLPLFLLRGASRRNLCRRQLHDSCSRSIVKSPLL